MNFVVSAILAGIFFHSNIIGYFGMDPSPLPLLQDDPNSSDVFWHRSNHEFIHGHGLHSHHHGSVGWRSCWRVAAQTNWYRILCFMSGTLLHSGKMFTHGFMLTQC